MPGKLIAFKIEEVCKGLGAAIVLPKEEMSALGVFTRRGVLLHGDMRRGVEVGGDCSGRGVFMFR